MIECSIIRFGLKKNGFVWFFMVQLWSAKIYLKNWTGLLNTIFDICNLFLAHFHHKQSIFNIINPISMLNPYTNNLFSTHIAYSEPKQLL